MFGKFYFTLKRAILRLLCNFIPFKDTRIRVRRELFAKFSANPFSLQEAQKAQYNELGSLYAEHEFYGRIYYPDYHLGVPFGEAKETLYNEFGEKLEVYFLRDLHGMHCGFGTRSRHFMWERYNFGLMTHFYSHNAMLETMGKPTRRYGMLVESEAIVPQDYHIFDTHEGLERDFDLIFTYSARILDKVPNARFVPFCATIWNAERIAPDLHTKKSKNVSILSSDKLMCELHKFRFDLAHRCKKEGLCDTFGTFDRGGVCAYRRNAQ